MGAFVGASVGANVGALVGALVGAFVGVLVGALVAPIFGPPFVFWRRPAHIVPTMMRCHENRTGVSSSSTTLTLVDGTFRTCGLCV